MRIRVLYDIDGTPYKRGQIIKVDRQKALYWIQEGLACLPTENRIKLPKENRGVL